MKRSLLLTNDYPPLISGISTVFYHVWKYFPRDRMLVMSPRSEGWAEFDARDGNRPIRYGHFATGNFSKVIMMMAMALRTAYLVSFRGVREIHAGQILACGPVGYFFQAVFGIPCYLWVYGGETTDAYRRSRLEEWLVEALLRKSYRLVTNSPGVTQEFIDYGIPEYRLIEIIPAVDADVFTPGDKPAGLIERYGVEGEKVLLTVSRLTKRKGHDLVLRALALLKDREDIHYIIVGDGEDRPRLEKISEENGLTERVTFAGRVDDDELVELYRLCDLYVMPNREVPELTDSIEGFGISFIEANACGKPSIAGRSGGTAAAVVDGVTGYIVDPENPEELAEKIRNIFDNPELSEKLGRDGRARVVEDFTWLARARKLNGFLTLSVNI